jgi:hypothetical protein
VTLGRIEACQNMGAEPAHRRQKERSEARTRLKNNLALIWKFLKRQQVHN